MRSTTAETRARAERLALGAQACAPEADAAITEAATNWRFDRIAPVDRTILRLGTYELMRKPGRLRPWSSTRRWSWPSASARVIRPAFVNGVLDAIRRRVRGESPAQGSSGMSDEPSSRPGEPPVPGWPAESAQRLEKAAAVRALGVTRCTRPATRARHRLGEIVAAYGDLEPRGPRGA